MPCSLFGTRLLDATRRDTFCVLHDLLLAVTIGYLVFAEVPTRSTLLGAAVVIAAGVLIIWRERQLGLERARERAAGRSEP